MLHNGGGTHGGLNLWLCADPQATQRLLCVLVLVHVTACGLALINQCVDYRVEFVIG